MAKRKKGYRRVYDEGTGKTKLGRRKEVDVFRPITGVGKTLVKDITYKSDDSPRVKYTEREVTRRNKDGSVKSYKNIVRKNGKIVEEATTKKIKYKDGGPKVKQRRGSRKNYDYKTWTPSGLQFPTSESSHLMMAEYDDDIDPSTGKPVGWVGFPSLFQDDKPYANDQDNWVQMSGDNGWGSIYEEAKRRGEVYYFGEDKDAAIAFGEGSWKDQLPDEGIEVELTDEEVEQYKAGGYVLEELKEGGEDDLITYKNNKSKVDGTADWNWSSDVDISSAYNDQIKARLLTGNYGYNPKTGELVKLDKSQQTKVTDKDALDTKKTLKETAGMSSKEYEIFQDNEKEAGRQRLMDDYTSNRKLVSIDKADEWNPSFTIQNESGQDINTQDYAGKQVYMTDAEEAAYKKAVINQNIPATTKKMNNAFATAAAFTPAGMAITGLTGATKLATESAPELIKNPSWSNAGAAGLDLLMASPLVIPAGIATAKNLKGVDDVVNVSKKANTPAIKNNNSLTKIQKLKNDGIISPTLNEQALIDNPNLLDAAVRNGIKRKLTVNRNVFSGDDFASSAFPEASTEALYTGSHTSLLGNAATGQRVGLKKMSAGDDALYTFRGKGDINQVYGSHNVESRIPFDYSGSTDEMVTNFNNLQKSRVLANPAKVANVPANQIKPGAVIDDVSGDGITAVVGKPGDKVLDPIKVTTDVKYTELAKNSKNLRAESDAFQNATTKDVSAINKKYNTNFKNAEETQKYLDKKSYDASKELIKYRNNPPKNPVLKTTNYSPFLGFEKGGYIEVELSDGGGTYTVQSGDTFRGIANRLGIPFKDLEKANPGINYDKLSLGQVLNLPEAAKVEEKTTEKEKVKKDIVIDLEGLKKGIAHVESADGTLMINPTSSATGLYGQLYNEIKDMPELKGVTREQFAKDLDLQNKIFEKRFYEGLPGVPSLQDNALELYEEYSPQLKDFNYSYEDIATLSNFLGRQGTREFFASIRDSKKFKAPGINKTPGQYLEGTRPYYVPKEEQDGGSIEVELSDKDVERYVKGGYIVEEIPQFSPGGANDSDNPLADWANQQATLWSNLYETDPEGRALATSYFSNIGDNYNLGLIEKGKMPHWSAATVSNAVMANIGATDKETAQVLGFNPTASHSGYVRDAFKAAANPEYKYNRYVAEGVGDSEYGIGDILVKGRSGTKNWKYGDFEKANDSYESHGDIIVDKGVDDKGEYVVLAGGNLSDTYKNKKVYTSSLKNNYTVKLTDAKRGQRLYGSSQKSDNLGEDVTIDKKRSSPFANNFDWDIENDQSTEVINEDPFPISSYDNSSKLVAGNNNALFGPDTLGIGYVPYQYQFPDYLGRPKDEDAYLTDEDTSISNAINQNEIDKADDTEKNKVIITPEQELTEDQILTNKAKEIQKLGPLSMFSIDKLKKLVSPENATKLTSDNPTVKNELNLLKKSGEARDKRLEKGDVWISYNDPNPYMQTPGWISAQKSKFWTDPITGEKKKIKRHNPYSIVGSMMESAEDKKMIKELGEFYGDGSDKYGEWITADEVAKMEHASAVQNAWRDNPTMQNSGAAQEINILPNILDAALLRYNPLAYVGWETGSNIVNRVIESETGGPPVTGSIFKDIKNRPGAYQEVPQNTSKGFIESLPDIGKNISNWPLVKDVKYWWDNFEDGGSIPKARDGRVVSKLWKDVTGTPWSQAKAQGLTDGSYAQNIALRNKLLSGELGEVTPAKSSSSFDYDAYDANVKRLVDKGYSLDDLVRTKMGTMSGLTSRFPNLFNEASKPEVAELSDEEVEELKNEGYEVEEVEEEVVEEPKVIKAEEPEEEEVADSEPVSNVVSDEDLGKWAMTAKLPAKLKAKVDKIKNSPMGKDGNLDYTRVVYDLGRDALLKEYTPGEKMVKEVKEVKEEPVTVPNFLILKRKLKFNDKLNKSFSELYDEKFNSNLNFDLRSEEEKEMARQSKQQVEDEINQLNILQKANNTNLIDTQYSSEETENQPASFEDWYADKIKRYDQAQSIGNNNSFTPIMANHPANAFRNQTDKGGMLYDGPLTSGEKFIDEVGEYVDAAAGLPKKIYEGVSEEVEDIVDKLQKTSILPGKITNDAELLYKAGSAIVNKDYEALLETKYGQDIALKILDQNENPNKYNFKFKTLTEEEQQWLRRKLEKEGRIDTPDAILKPVKEKIVEATPDPETFTERIGDVTDSYAKKYKLLSYRNQWDNDEGFVYTTAPTKQHRKNSDTYSNVIGVGHFLLDASMDPTNPYNHRNNKAYINKAMANDEWIPTFTNVGPHQIRLKYKKPADILETDSVSAPLRQFKFSDINFKTSKTPKGFRSTVHEVTTKDGDGTYLLFKSKDGYSRFSGGSVVFIFEDSYGNVITRDFAGSLNSIQKEGASIQKQYALKPGDLTIGYHDVGSFSAKPKADNNNVLRADQWKGYNNNGYTGGALLIPTSQPLSPKENRSQMERMFPNTYNK